MKKDLPKIIYITYLLLGTGMIILGLITLKKSMDLIRSGQQVTATVVKFTTYEKKFTTYFMPVFEFTTPTGRKALYHHSVASSPSPWKVGDTATIVYDVNQPQNIEMVNFWGLYGPACVVFLMGMVFLFAGGIKLFLNRKK
jgi:hypothetical protein